MGLTDFIKTLPKPIQPKITAFIEKLPKPLQPKNTATPPKPGDPNFVGPIQQGGGSSVSSPPSSGISSSPKIDTTPPEEKLENLIESNPVLKQIAIAASKPPTPDKLMTADEYQQHAKAYYTEQYTNKGFIPYTIRSQIAQQTPEEIKRYNLQTQYTKTVYENYLGVNTGVRQSFESDYETAWDKTHDINWASKNIVFEGIDLPSTPEKENLSLTYEKLKKKEPAFYLEKSGLNYKLDYNPIKWQQEMDKQHAWWDVPYQASKTYGYLAGNITRFWEEVTGPSSYEEQLKELSYYNKPLEYHEQRLTELRASEQYSITQKYARGDIVGVTGDVILKTPLIYPVSYAAVKGVGLAARGFIPAVKTGVQKIPTVYEKYKTVFPKAMVTESNELIGQTYFRSFASNVGRSQFWQNISGWSTNTLSRVRMLPLVKGPTIENIEEGLNVNTRIYKGFGNVDWVPNRLAFRTGVGLSGEANVSYTGEHSIFGLGTRSNSAFRYITKPSGNLWWKKIYEYNIYYSEFEPTLLESSSKALSVADTWGGFVKPGTNYTFMAVQKIKPVGFLRNTDAYTTLTHQISARPMVSGGLHHIGYLGTENLLISASEFKPVFNINTNLISSSVGTVLGGMKIKDYYSVNLPDVRQNFKPLNISLQIPLQAYRFDSVSGVIPVSVSLTRQQQLQQQALAQMNVSDQALSYKEVQTYKSSHSPNVGMYFSKPSLARIPKLSKNNINKIIRRNKMFSTGSLGYRYRKWKTPRLSDLLKGW